MKLINAKFFIKSKKNILIDRSCCTITYYKRHIIMSVFYDQHENISPLPVEIYRTTCRWTLLND